MRYENERKGKQYADFKRRTIPNDIKEENDVVLKQQKLTDNLSSTFEPTTYKVKERNASKIVVENTETSAQYRKNVAHAKKIPFGRFLTPENATNSGEGAKAPEQNDSSSVHGTNVPELNSNNLLLRKILQTLQANDQNQNSKRIAPKRYGFED